MNMNMNMKTEIKSLPTNYSTWVVAVLMGIAAYWMQLPPAEQASLMAAYPWLKHVAPLAGLVTFLVSRVLPQGVAPAAETAEPPKDVEQ